MRVNDAQLGKPGTAYSGTKAAIEALAGVTEGSVAYATDTDQLGSYNGSAWTWVGTVRERLAAARTYYVRTAPATVTMTIASPAVVTWTSHGLQAGDPVVFSTSGALPTGVTAGMVYYVLAADLSANTFKFSASVNGAAVNTSGSQSGTHKAQTGSDANDGLAATRSGALLTIQRAVDLVSQLDINSYTVTIQVADGLYLSGVTLKNVAGYAAPGNLVIVGNASTPGNCVVSTTSAACFQGVALSCAWNLSGFKLQTTTSGACVLANKGSYISLSNIEFGACAGQHMYASRNGIIDVATNYTISGGATYHLLANYQGRIECASMTATLTANVSITIFAAATYLAMLLANGMTFSLGAYTVTGTRYSAQASAVIYTNSGGASYFPGTIAGSTATNGQYL